MKNYKLVAALFVLPTLVQASPPRQASPCVQKSSPCLPCSQKSAWSFYGAFGAGLTYLTGNWNLTNLTVGTNRTSKPNLSSRSGRMEVYFGTAWQVPTTGLKLGLEPYFAYYNLQQSGSTSALLGNLLGVNVFDSISQTVSSNFALGLDFCPSFQFEGTPHSVYGLIGFSVTQLSYKFQDQTGSLFRTNKYPWGLNWGLGYEYQINKSSSSIGFRFREELYNQQTASFGNAGGNFFFKAKPRVNSYMLTYKYTF